MIVSLFTSSDDGFIEVWDPKRNAVVREHVPDDGTNFHFPSGNHYSAPTLNLPVGSRHWSGNF